VTKKWEAAADDIMKLNIDVAKVRIGIVLDNKGGALPKMTKPIRMYVGTAFGKGTQWQQSFQSLFGCLIFLDLC